MDEGVHYSSLKFKKQGETAVTQDEDGTYSEVKTINPTFSAEKRGQSSHPYRLAAVCLGLLCTLLLAATLVLCVLYASLSQSCSMCERDLERSGVNNSATNQEKDQLERDNNRLKQEKDQLQRDYSAVFKKLPFMEQYCPFTSQKRECKPCLPGWELFSSKCYYFSTERKSWTDSRSDCIKLEADLVIIESKEEQDFISKNRKIDYYWIGLRASGSWGTWLWVDGSSLKNTFWGGRQPSYNWNYCVSYHDTWYTSDCTHSLKWICETNALLP